MGTKDKIAAVAKKRGITIAELEKMAGISQGQIGHWNKVNPTVKSLQKVAKILKVSTNSLIGDET